MRMPNCLIVLPPHQSLDAVPCQTPNAKRCKPCRAKHAPVPYNPPTPTTPQQLCNFPPAMLNTHHLLRNPPFCRFPTRARATKLKKHMKRTKFCTEGYNPNIFLNSVCAVCARACSHGARCACQRTACGPRVRVSVCVW